MKITDCGAANLLAAIFGEEPDKVRARLGIPVKDNSHPCLNCRKPINKGLFCDRKCQKEYRNIKLVCDMCGGTFTRYQPNIVNHLSHPQSNGKVQEHVFCSKKCNGKYAGTHYGFLAHPENSGRGGRKRKYDKVRRNGVK